jgi:hypothetical protein
MTETIWLNEKNNSRIVIVAKILKNDKSSMKDTKDIEIIGIDIEKMDEEIDEILALLYPNYSLAVTETYVDWEYTT